MRILLLFLTFTFAGELEVQGDLKVSGSIDAQNNPIKNVGIPQELTDAINGNVLQDALRDDGPFEYKMYITRMYSSRYQVDMYWYEYVDGQAVPSSVGSEYWNTNFHNVIFSLLNDNWKFDNVITMPGIGVSSDEQTKTLFVFKKPIEE